MKRFIAIALSLLIIGFNLGLTFNVHFCKGRAIVQSISFGNQNSGCNRVEDNCSNTTKHQNKLSKKACCQNQHQDLKSCDFSELKNNITLKPNNHKLAWADVFVTVSFKANKPARIVNLYSPPIVYQNKPILFRSILI